MISIQELHRVSLGRILEEIRLHKGIQLSDVASKLGLHQATIRAWELSKPFIILLRPDVERDSPDILKFQHNKHRMEYITAWLQALDVPADQHDWFLFNAYRADYYLYLQPFNFNPETRRMLCTAMALNRQADVHLIAATQTPGTVGLDASILSEIPKLPAIMVHLPIKELQ